MSHAERWRDSWRDQFLDVWWELYPKIYLKLHRLARARSREMIHFLAEHYPRHAVIVLQEVASRGHNWAFIRIPARYR